MTRYEKIKEIYDEINLNTPKQSLMRILWEHYPRYAPRIHKAIFDKKPLPSAGVEEEILDDLLSLFLLKLHEAVIKNIQPQDWAWIWERYKEITGMFECKRTVHFEEWHEYFMRLEKLVRKVIGKKIYKDRLWKYYDRRRSVYEDLVSLSKIGRFEEMLKRWECHWITKNVSIERSYGEKVWRLVTYEVNSDGVVDMNTGIKSEDYIYNGFLKIQRIEKLPVIDSDNKLWFRVHWPNQSWEIYSAILVQEGDEQWYDRIWYQENAKTICPGQYYIGFPKYIQGDLALVQWSEVPYRKKDIKNFSFEKWQGNIYIYKYSDWVPKVNIVEKVFPRHRFEGTFDLLIDFQKVVLNARKKMTITHSEHGVLTIPKGEYVIGKVEGHPVRPSQSVED